MALVQSEGRGGDGTACCWPQATLKERRMPISGRGWEMLVTRKAHHQHGNKVRTFGSYRVYHDGRVVSGLAGGTAEPGGPGCNRTPDSGRCIERGTYPIATHDGDVYCSIGHVIEPDLNRVRRPALGLLGTGVRTDILIHPGHGFLASTGCINPTPANLSRTQDIDFADSFSRTLELMEDLRTFA